MRADLLRNGVRGQVAEAVATHDLRGFLLLYGEPLVVLVGLPVGDVDVEAELLASEQEPGMLPFRTETCAPPTGAAARPRASASDEAGQVGKGIERQARFAVALRKRAGSDVLYADRISVGRARNKDIVLRHASVSKFHAWFEVDDDGVVQVVDAESKNLTRVNGAPVPPRSKAPVTSGDIVHFGAIECVLASPSTLWKCLREGAPSTGAYRTTSKVGL